VALLQDIRTAQQVLSDFAASGSHDSAAAKAEVSVFLESLSTAWKDGEVRPTHRKKAGATHWWSTRADPFEHTWCVIEGWLASEPAVTASELMDRLAVLAPDVYASKAQLRTMQRRVKAWRAEKAKDLILRRLRQSSAVSTEP
jgi:hypothetical protein